MTRTNSTVLLAALCFSVGPFMAAPASAGDGNKLYVKQETTFGTSGNSLLADQSLANDSLVRGLQAGDPALQKGSDNSATLTIEGNGGTIQLLQDNSVAAGNGNTAVATLNGNGLATVSQTGAQNLAKIDVSGTLTKGSIFQEGDNNIADLTVSGSNTSGSITQNGDQNDTTFDVTGTGTSVDYTLNGTGYTTPVGATGVQVYSNANSVQITQTPLP